MRSIAGLLGFLVFAVLVYVLFVMGSGTKIGKAIDPCQRAAAVGAQLPGCK